MKRTCLTLGAAFSLAFSAGAQQLPAARFARATSVGWEKEGSDYEVGFWQAGREMSAVITPASELKQTETALNAAQLPAAVQATLARNYKAATVAEAATIVRANGTTVYEAELSERGQKRDVLFTADGRVTK